MSDPEAFAAWFDALDMAGTHGQFMRAAWDAAVAFERPRIAAKLLEHAPVALDSWQTFAIALKNGLI